MIVGTLQRLLIDVGSAGNRLDLFLAEHFKPITGSERRFSRSEIQNEFQVLRERLRKTIVFVTHDVGEALMFGDRIGLMQDGSLIALTTKNEFLNSENADVQSFLAPIRSLQPLIR